MGGTRAPGDAPSPGIAQARRRVARKEAVREVGARMLLVGGPAASLRRSAVGGLESCFATYIGRAGKSISMPTLIGAGCASGRRAANGRSASAPNRFGSTSRSCQVASLSSSSPQLTHSEFHYRPRLRISFWAASMRPAVALICLRFFTSFQTAFGYPFRFRYTAVAVSSSNSAE